MIDTLMVDSFREELLKIQSEVCWGVTAGKGTGSMVSLCFGEKIRRKKPVDNPHLSEDVRNFDAEYCLYLQECGWRLQTCKQVIASSASPNDNDGPMLAGLRSIVGERVLTAEVEDVSCDLKLEFSNGVNLRVFCFGRSGEEWDNYTFYTPAFWYSSTSNGHLDSGAREVAH